MKFNFLSIHVGNVSYDIPFYISLTGEQEIRALKVKCNNDANGCDWVGELRSLDNHLTTCEYALLRCTNMCTDTTEFDFFEEEVYVLRRDMDNHLKNTCPNRQYQCPHCKDIGKHWEITTIHLTACPKFKIPCQNVGCNDSVPYSELSDHLTKCLFEKVPCKYAEIGCDEKPLRKDLQQHENNDTFHFHLAIETVNRQQREIKVLKEEQRAMKEEQTAMKDDIVHTQVSPRTYKMTNFNQQKALKQNWYSPPFYLHPSSYKICIRVYANGDGDGEGTHVSVFVYLMHGKNDDKLSWPFKGEVTVTLLNQLQDKNHHTHTLTYPKDKNDGGNRRVVGMDRGSVGYGWAKFISYDRLRYDAKQNCQYLKDDCLYFRIPAKAPKSWLTCNA